MPTIVQLPEDVITRIAAGEVIERPAYAVKELIENAIDSGADVITVTIEESGLKKIIVSDNGSGMSREDIEIAILPHTTSKIHSIEDLQMIRTLGFRGEALSSIGAISHLTLQSRLHTEPAGTLIKVTNGTLEHIAPVGTPPGTIVTVEHLFSSVPARKKFLKSPLTEFRHIVDVVTSTVLAYPAIHFTLIHNKKVIFDLPKKSSILDRIKMLLGESFVTQCIPITYQENHIVLSGFLGKPQIASRQQQKQFIFINNRQVSDKIISLAMKEAYGTLLPANNTPVFILTLSLPYELVDVNVHPRKEQAAFVNGKMLFDTVKQAVYQTLSDHNITYQLSKFKKDTSMRKGETTSFSSLLLKQEVLTPEKIEKDLILSGSPYIQCDRTYILTVSKDGILFFDQHAVSERILFEKFLAMFETQKKKKKVIELAEALSFTVTQSEAILIHEYLRYFEELGFSFEHFHETTFRLRFIPSFFSGRNIEKIIKDILVDLTSDAGIQTIDYRTKRMITYLACRAAVKSGDILSEDEMKSLLKELQEAKDNETCPHGRPTHIAYPYTLLNKDFKR